MSRYPPFCGFGLFIVFIIYSFLVVFYGAHLSLHLDEAIHFGEYLEEIIDVNSYLDQNNLYCSIQEEKVVQLKSKKN